MKPPAVTPLPAQEPCKHLPLPPEPAATQTRLKVIRDTFACLPDKSSTVVRPVLDYDPYFPSRGAGPFEPMIVPVGSAFSPTRVGPWPFDRRTTMGSLNWSGAFTVPNMGERFAIVAGQWTIPEIDPRLIEEPRICTTWIGMDGHRRHAGSLPQVGTSQCYDRKSRKAVYYAWCQWWVRGEKYPPWIIKDMPIDPGNRVVAWMSRQDHGKKVDIYLANIDAKKLVAFVFTAPDPNRPVEGKSAQWIAERTSKMDGSGMYDLPQIVGDIPFAEWAACGDAPNSTDDRLVTRLRLYQREPVASPTRTVVRLVRPPSCDEAPRRRRAPIAVIYKND